MNTQKTNVLTAPQKFVEGIKVMAQLKLATVAGIVASTTQTQEAATPLTGIVNFIGTCANSGDAVLLPPAEQDLVVIVVNDGAAACAVFPSEDDAIHEGTDDAKDATDIPVNEARIYVATSDANWESISIGDIGA